MGFGVEAVDFVGDPDDDPEDDADPEVEGGLPAEDELSEEEDVVELLSVFVLEELVSPLPLSLWEPVVPLSCLPSAEELGFDKLGSFSLLE